MDKSVKYYQIVDVPVLFLLTLPIPNKYYCSWAHIKAKIYMLIVLSSHKTDIKPVRTTKDLTT